MKMLLLSALALASCAYVSPKRLAPEDVRRTSVLSICQHQDEIVLINECYVNFMSACLDNPNNRLASCEDVAKSRCTVIKCLDIPKDV